MDRFDRSYDDIIIFLRGKYCYDKPTEKYLETQTLKHIVATIPHLLGVIKRQTEALCIAAVQQYGNALQYVWQPCENMEVPCNMLPNKQTQYVSLLCEHMEMHWSM